ISAVSNSVIPRSNALSTTLRVASRSIFMPKLLQPSPTIDTCNPEFPNLRNSTRRLLWKNCPNSPTIRRVRAIHHAGAAAMPSSRSNLGRDDLIASSYTLSGSAVFQPPQFSFADRVAAAADAGFDAIGVAVEDYSVMRERGSTDAEMRRILDDHGIVAAELEFLTNWWWSDER